MDYTKKIEACNTLDELFSLWREAQGKEPEGKCLGEGKRIGTFPRKKLSKKEYETPVYKTETSFKDSFCPDGITSEAGHESSANRCQVLFILKESNVVDEDGYITKGNDNNKFWFNDAVENSERKKYAGRFQLVIQRLIETQGLKQKDSKLYGYMNLNKRGGYGTTDDKALAAYMQEYQSFIRKQIFLLSPKFIVCCGNYELLRKELFKTAEHNASVSIYPQQYKIADDYFAKVYYVYHPSNYEKKFIRGLDFIG
jgi:hypothetical protein